MYILFYQGKISQQAIMLISKDLILQQLFKKT